MAAPTDIELLASYRVALSALSTAQSYTMPDQRVLTRAHISEVRTTIEWLEQRIAAADTSVDETGTNVLLVKFGR